jgi:hypothetical protein
VRYRDLDHIDLDAAREKVRQWMADHPGGTAAQMAADLKGDYPQYPEHMAVVLRGLMAALRDHPEGLDPAQQVPHD